LSMKSHPPPLNLFSSLALLGSLACTSTPAEPPPSSPAQGGSPSVAGASGNTSLAGSSSAGSAGQPSAGAGGIAGAQGGFAGQAGSSLAGQSGQGGAGEGGAGEAGKGGEKDPSVDCESLPIKLADCATCDYLKGSYVDLNLGCTLIGVVGCVPKALYSSTELGFMKVLLNDAGEVIACYTHHVLVNVDMPGWVFPSSQQRKECTKLFFANTEPCKP
jgi:hypothetical protein